MTLARRFETLVAESGGTLAELTPRAAIDLLLRLLAEGPGSAALFAHWGNVSHFGPPRPGFTCSLEFASLDPLELRFRYGLEEAAGNYRGRWPRIWCLGPDEAEAFRAECDDWDALQALGDRPAEAVVLLGLGRAWVDEFHDCWGVRNPEQPVVQMTEGEWIRSDDTGRMLRWLRQEWRAGEGRDLCIRRYLLACCRRLWPLLLDGRSRWAVEAGERRLEGEEVAGLDWQAEGAAFHIELAPDSDEVVAWCAQVGRIPTETLDAMLFIAPGVDRPPPQKLLERAAYFVSSAITYPGHPAYDRIPQSRIARTSSSSLRGMRTPSRSARRRAA